MITYEHACSVIATMTYDLRPMTYDPYSRTSSTSVQWLRYRR